uniref:Uncharacterized protein n=1 Tax=Lactuca sativa TaxID=4236 RepID=A0A9R1XLH1_LACSA|nr:hypothetical protein LSAT_V11C400203000 [Lactuca sativa]
MSERTGRVCTYLLCEYVIELHRGIYLRHPTKSDAEELYLAHQAKHGFSGMFGSIDCTHWEWANCLNAWHDEDEQDDGDDDEADANGDDERNPDSDDEADEGDEDGDNDE